MKPWGRAGWLESLFHSNRSFDLRSGGSRAWTTATLICAFIWIPQGRCVNTRMLGLFFVVIGLAMTDHADARVMDAAKKVTALAGQREKPIPTPFADTVIQANAWQEARRRSGGSRSSSSSRGYSNSASSTSDCSCSGGNVCIGPRGGRYCITAGGNKRYGR